MKNKLENRMGDVLFLAGRRRCRRVSKVFRKRRALTVLSFVLMVLIGTVSAEESIEHGYFTNAVHHPEVPRISAAETKKLFDQGELLLVNVMESVTYERDHIVGSILMASDQGARWKDAPLPENVILAIFCH